MLESIALGVGEGRARMKARSKFAIGSGIIVVTLVSLAYVGFTQSKTYYHTISELGTLHGASTHQRMRVSGNVRAGTIERRCHPDRHDRHNHFHAETVSAPVLAAHANDFP